MDRILSMPPLPSQLPAVCAGLPTVLLLPSLAWPTRPCSYHGAGPLVNVATSPLLEMTPNGSLATNPSGLTKYS
eukprot:5445230-Amphidinium_carterae.1